MNTVSLLFTAIEICIRIYFLFDTSNFLKKKKRRKNMYLI